ncbi:MAG: glyoxalase [Acidimicrobiales bacterium]
MRTAREKSALASAAGRPVGGGGGQVTDAGRSRPPEGTSFGGAMALRTSGVRQPSIWASVVSDDALALRDWLLALWFTEDLMIPGERGGLVHHCQLDWPEGGRVLLSSTGERVTPCRPGTSSLHVVTSDPDPVLERARAIGATVVHPIVDQTDYPSRDFTVEDSDGNHWTFATFAG